MVGSSLDSPLEEAGFEPSVPPQEGTGSPAGLIEIVPQPVLPTAKRTVRLLVRIRFPPAVSQGELSYCAPGSFRSRTPSSFAKRPYAIDAAKRSRLPTISTKLGTSTRDGISYWLLASHVA